MQMITLFLAILALLSADAALILVVLERKNNRVRFEKRFSGFKKAMVDYVAQEIQTAITNVSDGAAAQAKIVNGKINKVIGLVRTVNSKVESVKKMAEENKHHIEDLENGIVPNFEAAQAAVKAVNDVNEGIAGILNYDPLEALKQSREQEVK